MKVNVILVRIDYAETGFDGSNSCSRKMRLVPEDWVDRLENLGIKVLTSIVLSSFLRRETLSIITSLSRVRLMTVQTFLSPLMRVAYQSHSNSRMPITVLLHESLPLKYEQEPRSVSCEWGVIVRDRQFLENAA